MPWKVTNAMSLRSELVKLMQQDGANVSELCRRYGVSRATGYKWLRRAQAGQAMTDRSRKPIQSPAQTDALIEARVVALRREHPAWGSRKLRKRLQVQGAVDLPATSTITGILHRHGLVGDDAWAKRQPMQRFEHPEPNDLWQMDFKGHFPLEQGHCHALTVTDDHSRFNLRLEACSDERTETVQSCLIDAFRLYGLPKRMLMDNGAPWGNSGTGPFTPLTVWLMLYGIGVSHGRPYHPQTQGKEERFHRTFQAEVLQGRSFRDLAHCQRHFDAWREIYNEQRPHEALALEVPSSRYQASPRSFPEKPPVLEYASDLQVRTVHIEGWLTYKGKEYRLPKALRGYRVGIRPTATEGIMDILFGSHHILVLDLKSGIATKPVNHVSAHL